MVKVAPSVPEADTMVTWLEDRAQAVLKVRGEALEDVDLIRIMVDGGPFDYRVTLALFRREKALPPQQQPEPFDCDCSTEQMLEGIEAPIGAAAQTLEDFAEQEHRERDEALATAKRRRAEERRRLQVEQRAAAQQAAEQQPTRYRPTRLGRTGIGLLGAGGMATLSGIIMVTRPAKPLPGYQTTVRNWAPPGFALLGVGVTAMVSGTITLVADIVRCRREPKRCNEISTHAHVSVSSNMAGR